MADAASLRLFVGLIVVIGAIMACGWLARRMGFAGRPQGARMRIVDSLNLGPRQRIVLVEVQDSWLVVGVTAGQMNVLHTLPADEADAPRAPDAPAARALALFGGRPRQNVPPGGAPPLAAEGLGATFAHKLARALRRG
jgi:flagellar protein FliO/FliZ